MRQRSWGVSLVVAVAALAALGRSRGLAESPSGLDNPRIDMAGYLRVAGEAAAWREARRLTEEQFLAASREAGTIVLDARSAAKYAELHVDGAVNLSFPDLNAASLKQLVPDPATRILIYCNNNFRNTEGPFPSKRADASLNLSTYIALFSYGYRNVWELAPLLDPATTKLTLVSSPPPSQAVQSVAASSAARP